MERKEFDRILIEECILSKKTRDKLWQSRPTDDLSEASVRFASQCYKEKYPDLCKEDVL